MRPEPPVQLQRLLRVSPQRWLLSAIAVASAAGTSILIGVTGGGLPPLVLVLVTAFAAISAARPDAHVASVVIGVVIWQWLVVTDDPTGPVVLGVALGLLVFHSSIALMGPAPVTTTFGSDIVRRWSVRVGIVAAVTLGVWGLVLLFDTREADGDTGLTFAAFVAALGLMAALLRAAVLQRPLRDD